MLKSIYFSAGPCKKIPQWNINKLADGFYNRSHITSEGRSKIKEIYCLMRHILKLPQDYKIFFTPASGSGAIEAAMWNILSKDVECEVLISDFFSKEWAYDITHQLKIPYSKKTMISKNGILEIPLDPDNDRICVWVETPIGLKYPNCDWIPKGKGITIVDAVSAAFLENLDWEKLDATAFSFQKILGGEAGIGVLILSPKAWEAIEKRTKDWPIPRIFRLIKEGEMQSEILNGKTLATPSMMAIEEMRIILNWVEKIGGIEGMQKRNSQNWEIMNEFMRENIFDFVVKDENLKAKAITAIIPKDAKWSALNEKEKMQKINEIAEKCEGEKVFDIASFSYPCWRFWLGPTQEAEDISMGLERFRKIFKNTY